MADPYQIKILEQGKEAWNEWLKENSHQELLLSEAELSEADLKGIKFSKANLSGANLRKADLSGADLSEADLSGANLSEAKLWRVKLSGADLSEANLSWAKLWEANLIEADLSGANFTEANLSEADLSRTNLSEAEISGANLWRVKLREVDFQRENFSKADLSEADLRGIKFSKADLSEANLRKADLSAADLRMADLSRTNLSGANLWKADLRKADLKQANLINSNLSGADISGANITAANLYNWKIEGIKCTHVIWKNKRIDYENVDDFEKAFTEVEKVVEMLLDLPFSELSYLTGSVIEQAINQKYGEGSIVFKGQAAISNDTTKFDFLSFSAPDELAEIKDQLSGLAIQLKPVIEEAKSKDENQSAFGVKPEIDLPFTRGALVVRPKALERVMNERYAQMHPLLQNIIHTIQLHIR